MIGSVNIYLYKYNYWNCVILNYPIIGKANSNIILPYHITVPRKVSLVIPDELMERIREWAKDKNEKSLIFGVRISTAIRKLVERGLEYDRKQ